MKPRLEPKLWKKYIWKSQYEKEKDQYKYEYETLLGAKNGGNEKGCAISKQQFIDGVIKEIRDGNQEVNKVRCNLFIIKTIDMQNYFHHPEIW